MQIVRCPSCDGYGWLEADEDAPAGDCRWCAGAGYVWRDARGVDRPIAPEQYPQVAETLEALEAQRLREMGYSGGAKKPWEQAIRGANAARLRGGAGADNNNKD